MDQKYIELGKIGKSIGLNGGVKLYITGDFTPKNGAKFYILDRISSRYIPICLLNFNTQKNLAIFEGYSDIQSAKMLTNQILYTTEEDTLRDITLGDDEFFWFELIGFSVIDQNQLNLGQIKDIERISNIDYLIIDSSKFSATLPQTFMIPYIDRYVINVDKMAKIVLCKDILGILESS